VAVAHDVGLDDHLVTANPLDREPAAVDLGADAVDRAASPPGGGKLGMLVRHGCLRRGSSFVTIANAGSVGMTAGKRDPV
jgi:hypothetical protein